MCHLEGQGVVDPVTDLGVSFPTVGYERREREVAGIEFGHLETKIDGANFTRLHRSRGVTFPPGIGTGKLLPDVVADHYARVG